MRGVRGARARRGAVAVVALAVAALLAGGAPAPSRPDRSQDPEAAPVALDRSQNREPVPGRPDRAPEPVLAPGLPVAPGLPPGAVRDAIGPRPGAGQRPVPVFVELDRIAAIDAYSAARQAGRSISAAGDAATAARQRASQTADTVLTTLRDGGADAGELYRTANAVPGIAVSATPAQLPELAAMPQVRSVRTLVPKTPANSTAVQLTRTVQAWQQTGRFGDGVRIGIIDDGIDYTHADFGGPGTPEAYAAIDRTRVEPSYFPTAKVVGGYDFAGDEYDASGASGPDALAPRPDPNPLSCGQHGTHVAGSAAGLGVDADGSTFRGGYRELDGEALNRMRIGPGTAPRAQLYALKVFGCGGSTLLTAAAMDRALDPNGDGDFSDRLDVVNMSLGSDYGAPDDPDNLFVRKLAENGVLPVIAAGNGGDRYDVGGSPGSTPEALTVASSRDSYVLRDGAEVTAPADVAGVQAGQYSVGYEDDDSLDLTAPVVPMSDPANADGCRPFTPADAGAVAGKLVWLEWDDDDATRRCGSAARTDNATAAGAAGVLLSSTVDQFTAGIAGNADIPVFQFTATATEVLRPALDAATLQVRLTGGLRRSVPTADASITDTPSGFTSRGVRAPAVKPDVSAPGDTITSALTGSGDGRLVISGTSMATPHVAGVGVLVGEAHPEWTTEEIKAAVMNTAIADIRVGGRQQGTVYAPNRVGAGRVDARAALGTELLAMVADDPGHVSVDFGVVEVAGPTTLSRTIEVVNKGDAAARLAAEYQPITTVPGVTYELSAGSVEVAPGQTASLTVTLRIVDPVALRKTADPTIEKITLGVARQFLADASGRVVLDPVAGADPDAPPLRVPVYSAPRPVADITGPDEVSLRGRDAQAVLNLSGRAVDQGSGDAAYRSLVTVLTLQAASPRLPDCGPLTVDCAPNRTARGGDIRYVGATSTAPLAIAQQRPDRAVLGFGVATWDEWYNVGDNTVPFVDIDTTGDGLPDFETYVTKPAGTDVLLAATVDLNAEGAPVVDTRPVNGRFGDVDTNVSDTDVILLPVSLTALGIDPAAESAPVSYTAGIAGYYTGPGDTDGVIDSIGPRRFDAARPGLWVQGGGDVALSYLALPGTALVVNRDSATSPSRLLVLHHHNASGDRAQTMEVRAPDRQSGLLDLPVAPASPASPASSDRPAPVHTGQPVR